MRRVFCYLGFALLSAGPAFASAKAAPAIHVAEIACLPSQYNAALTAKLSTPAPGVTLRLYFRRLNPVGAFYYTEMKASAPDSYWTVFPKAEDRRQHLLTDDWWDVLEDRFWLQDKGGTAEERRRWLDGWLREQRHEAAEFYVAIADSRGEEIARSATRLLPVRSAAECPAALVDCQVEPTDSCLTDRETRLRLGWANNLTVGETTDVQAGRCLFHWLCFGVVTRISRHGILGPDMCCRGCVVPAAVPVAAGGVVAAALIVGGPETPASPEQPCRGSHCGGGGNGNGTTTTSVPVLGALIALLSQQRDEPTGTWACSYQRQPVPRRVAETWWQQFERGEVPLDGSLAQALGHP